MRVERDGIGLNVKVEGPENGPAVVFANSLGTNLQLWDDVVARMPPALRLVRYDLRGHGGSDVPEPPYSMGQLVSDAEAICDACNIRDCVFVGLSVGGLIAQGLAVKRPDIIRALVLSNTAAKIGHPLFWQSRIAMLEKEGMRGAADQIMHRWFGRDFYGTPAMSQWLEMLMTAPLKGYIGVCTAISGTDFFTPTSGLRVPTLGVAGSEDGTTPPDLVRETVDLIPGSQFALIRRVGHLPPAEDPQAFAELLNQFLQDIGHLLPLAK
ncbi:3-oxoadipate enol-lactonase [Yoonia sp. SS1-5]|uniref:3-oxoadipate enol-lactonase n=1 Tax=Yoonia rhodophyticola TaxID=3137370 RepID=A0AAN0M8Q0_9RHOB